jgi:hypothetical protein
MAMASRLCLGPGSHLPRAAASHPALRRPLGACAQRHRGGQRGMAMEAFAASIQADTAWVQKIAAGGVGDSDASCSFVDAIEACTGRVLVTGIGKSGCVGRRMSVSLMSTGTLAHFVVSPQSIRRRCASLGLFRQRSCASSTPPSGCTATSAASHQRTLWSASPTPGTPRCDFEASTTESRLKTF